MGTVFCTVSTMCAYYWEALRVNPDCTYGTCFPACTTFNTFIFLKFNSSTISNYKCTMYTGFPVNPPEFLTSIAEFAIEYSPLTLLHACRQARHPMHLLLSLTTKVPGI